jgi:recombination protein RecR
MMTRLPDPIRKLTDQLSELPSIGPRQAVRLAFYLIAQGQNSIRELSQNLSELQKIKLCERCFFIHQNADALCDICRDSKRDQGIIMIVEKETDLISLDNTGKFKGRYLILGPIPKVGLLEDWQKLRLQSLKGFIEKNLGGKAKEIILAFNPTSLGDFNANIISKELSGLTEKISRLGRGLPTGGEIEFADDETLGGALQGRS